MASLYLADDLAQQQPAPGSEVVLGGDEARHAIGVARIRIGESVALGDGAGLIVRGAVAATDGGMLRVAVVEVATVPAPTPALWLAQALAKGDRDELAIQAATELGASGVIPWAAERSVSRWEGMKAQKGRDRWASIVREASKQAIRPHVPEVAALASATDLGALPGRVLVLEPTAEVPLTAVTLDADRITLVVGPEGGISPRELALLADDGATAVRLGDEVLRTSTAGPAALAVLNARLARW